MPWRRPRTPFPSSAPADWLNGRTSAARLHVRLIKAVNLAAKESGTGDEASTELVLATDDLRRAAAAIDARLVAVSRLPVLKRQRELLPLRREVDDLENAALRIAMSAIEGRGFGQSRDELSAVHERLDTLADARHELRNLSGAERQQRELLKAALRRRLGRGT